jgi:hypothetical protein
MKYFRSILVFFFSVGFIFISCTDYPSSPSPATEGNIKISVKNLNSSALGKIAGVTITEARIVIKEIEFESSLGDSLDFELEQPFIQDLLAGSALHEIQSVVVPFGSYKETEIEIDDLDKEDGAVYTQNPELQDKSILVKGFVNGDRSQAFTFSTKLEAEQEREFNPPLILDENSPSTNIVITIDMSKWFLLRGDNIDPRISDFRSIIEENIEASLDIFEDDDDDGEDDDHDDDGVEG